MSGFTAFLLLGFIGISLSYEIGTLYKYSYETSVTVNEKCGFEGSPQAVGHQVKAEVHLGPIWKSEDSKQKLFKIQIQNQKLLVPKKASFEEHSSNLDETAESTFDSYFLFEEGAITKVWDNPTELVSVRNLKRGIATLLQLRDKDERTKENDVSGSCDVEYKVRGKSIRKNKGNCVHSKFDKTLSQPYGVRSASLHHHSTTDCELQDEKSKTISKCSVSEYVKMFSNAWHRPTLCVNSKVEFSFLGTDAVTSKKYENTKFEAVVEVHEGGLERNGLESLLSKKEEKKKDLKASITNSIGSLKTDNLAELKSASAFYRLLPVFRLASKVDILRVLKEKKFEEIRPQLLDLVSACATKDSLAAALEYFSDEKEYNEQLERFIISLSILPRPNDFILTDLMAFLTKGSHDKRIEAAILVTLGTLLKTYSENYAIADTEIIEKVRNFLENGLKKCSSDSDTCSLNYLRGLRNAAQPRSAPVFLEYAANGGKEALESVLALRRIPDRLLPPENQKKLLNVFNQVGVGQDRSTRGIAAELILRQHPEPAVLKNLLLRLSDQTDLEFSTFLSSKLSHMMSSDAELRKQVIKLLPEVFDFNFGAQEGQSSVFTRPMLSIEGTNVTYGLEAEMLDGGLLKRSVFDVSFENAAGGSNLLSVGIFAEGLGGFAGGATGSSDEGASPTAGMELGFLGSSLRPYVFFSSTSELMSHAWSGTASEPTPVLQCILAFSDDEKMVVLTNGMAVKGQLRGVLSSDASASIKISLWNRNSQSLVQTEGALLVRGSVSIDAGFVTTQGAIQFSGESGIDFKTDLDFYESPFTICLQMEHPDIAVKFDVHRSTVIPGTKYQLKKSKKRTIKIPGRSFALNEKNNEMCHVLKSNN